MKRKRKLIYMVVICCIAIIQMTISMNKSKALEINETTYLQRADKGFLSIQKWNGSQWMYVIHSITNFVDENGVSRVAYCVNPDLNGIGYIDGEFEGYDVQIKEYINDQRLWRVYTNGYPYKSPQEMGVENEDDAYLATKQATYCILRGYSIEDIRSLYREGQDYVEGEDLKDIERRGQKIIEAMCKLVDIGYNGTNTMQFNNILKIEKIGEFSEDCEKKEYYSQNYKVTCDIDFLQYKVESILNFPAGTYIANIQSNQQVNFLSNETFKVMIPKDKIEDNIQGTINIIGKCENFPIFYAESIGGIYQNYMLCVDSYSNDIQSSTVTDIDAYKSRLQIFKIDKESKRAIPNVKFSIEYDDGEKLGVYTTDENGVVDIMNIHKGKLIITEIENNKDYVLNQNPIWVDIDYNQLKTITVENEKKTGRIKIIKEDADDESIRIPNVKFGIFDEEGQCIEELITNENGEAISRKLPINAQYSIKEIVAAHAYEIMNESLSIKLDDNEIKTVIIKNKKNNVQIMPKTGRFDWNKILLSIIITTFVYLFIESRIIFSKKCNKNVIKM